MREVGKLANRGAYCPARKLRAGQWRFASSDINYWIETQMHAFTEAELAALERRGNATAVLGEPLVSSMLTESTIAVPLRASTKASVLKELVNLAEHSWQIYDPQALHRAILAREELGSDGGSGSGRGDPASASPTFGQGTGGSGARLRAHRPRHPVRRSGRRVD